MEDLVVSKCGLAAWEKVKEAAGCYMQTGDFILSVHYDDAMSYRLLEESANLFQLTVDEVLEMYGRNFIHFLEANHYSGLIKGAGNTLREWLQNINEPHRLLRARFPQCVLSEFWTENDSSDPTGGSALLHYYSARSGGLASMMVGMVKEAAKEYFDQDIVMELVMSEDLEGSNFVYHAIWRLRDIGKEPERNPYNYEGSVDATLIKSKPDAWVAQMEGLMELDEQTLQPRCPFHHMAKSENKKRARLYNSSDSASTCEGNCEEASKASSTSTSSSNGYSIGATSFKRIFPFHVVVNQQMQIVQIGNKLAEIFDKNEVKILGMPISEIFSLAVSDKYPWSWPGLRKLQYNSITLHSVLSHLKLKLTGEVTILDDYGEELTTAALLVSPVVSDLVDLMKLQLKVSDLPRHSFQRDVLQMEEHLKTELNNTVRMTQLSKRLDSESKRSTEALKMKRIFVRYVSHEIRTPLNVAILGLKYLEDELLALPLSTMSVDSRVSSPLGSSSDTSTGQSGEDRVNHSFEVAILKREDSAILMAPSSFDSDTVRDVVDDVKASCAMAVEILNDLLLYEKIDDGIFSLAKSYVNLNNVIREAEKLFCMQAKGAGIELIISGNAVARPIAVEVDKNKLQQVLRNLFTNAIKFTPQGGTIQMTYNVHLHVDDSCDEGITFDGSLDPPLVRPDSHVSPTDRQSQSHPSSQGESKLGLSSRGIRGLGMRPVSKPSALYADSSDESVKPTTVDRSFIRISVTDSGCGISKEDQISLFHEFIQVQADKLQNGQGSGLGLWIAANIMKMHGGRIGVTSEGEGKGTTFVIDLPLVLGADGQPTALSSDFLLKIDSSVSIGANGVALEPKLASTVSPPLDEGSIFPPSDISSPIRMQLQQLAVTELMRRTRVLIVDDASSNRKMVRRILQDKFQVVEEAENGQQAVEKYAAALAAAEPFHLVMMDFMMPVMNGLDATRLIKQLDASALVVGVTGNGLEGDIQAFKDSGADEVMIKPLNLRSFETVLFNHLSMQQLG